MGLPQSPDPKTYYRDQTWDAEYSNLGTATLETKRNRIEERLKKVRKEFKRKVSLNDNSDCWEMTLKVSFLHVKLARVTSQIERRKFDSHERWYNRSEAFNLKLRHDSWTQWESIMRKHESTVRKTTSRESYMRLFATSRVGLERDTSLQSNMAAEMERVYCPDHPKDWESYRWDPVLHDCILTDENGNGEGGESEIEAIQALVGVAAVKSSKEVLEALAEDDPDDHDDSDEDDYIVS
ncbi:hypothetical protein FCULG_00007113 [Fusarium culmorum]|uniref:Uncharacterized protein n=1 Tax=Fusarium culmorum TaxID=5516 RepID=A0A2T4GW61_FUSCU|nr:hypothetical protein FCULG_00007113 [Fusarium culmorum]